MDRYTHFLFRYYHFRLPTTDYFVRQFFRVRQIYGIQLAERLLLLGSLIRVLQKATRRIMETASSAFSGIINVLPPKSHIKPRVQNFSLVSVSAP